MSKKEHTMTQNNIALSPAAKAIQKWIAEAKRRQSSSIFDRGVFAKRLQHEHYEFGDLDFTSSCRESRALSFEEIGIEDFSFESLETQH
jgi:hypothetical protein